MAVEMDGSSQSSQTSNPFGSISILVVDDDTTCLAIVAAILKSWKYEVVTVKHASEALGTLRIKGGLFDLVVTDVHMPDMNGFELQKQIAEEFKLPVVLMSADDKESVILKGLQNGAAFFIVKPISPNDLKNLWQYAVGKKKKTKVVIEEIGNIQETSQADHKACNKDPVQETLKYGKGSDDEDVESASSSKRSTKESKRKASAKDGSAERGENKADSVTPKKAKVVWTNALHNQFLEAIRSIGLERAFPKKILELMNVPGLTRENVASHLQASFSTYYVVRPQLMSLNVHGIKMNLQKYRIFLKRVSEASYKIQSAAERSMIERTFRSNFTSGQPVLMHNIPGLQPFVSDQMKPPNHGNPSASNQEASSSNSRLQFGSGQSRLLCNQDASTSGGIISGANVTEMYQPKNQVAPKNFTNDFSKPNSATSGFRSPDIITHHGNIGAFNNPNLTINPNCNNSNYAGYRMARDGRLVGLGYMGAKASTDFNSNNVLITGMQNESMSTLPLLGGNSGDHLAQGESSIGFQIGSYISPTLSNVIQQENTSATLIPPTVMRHNIFGNEGESDYSFGLLNNVSNSVSNSFPQPYGECRSFSFPDQISIQSPTQQDDAEAFSGGSYHVEDDPLVNKHSLDKEQYGGEVMVPNFGIAMTQSDEYFLPFDQNPIQVSHIGVQNRAQDRKVWDSRFRFGFEKHKHLHSSKQDDAEFLESVFGSGEYGGDENRGVP
ncbi:putative two-component response regulator ARR21 isoform X3 [Actinidia eriantha]|uniref:putative two-component response regulator ARR21 isoform X3 n=1 Tax=Actinidia eriantha TaxID=165200 RepID=UPI00258B463D|nr:putative two-component response regulator ARR21 isoform X3 [Actinidia eriantha]